MGVGLVSLSKRDPSTATHDEGEGVINPVLRAGTGSANA